jgi:hypothetical protein
MNGGKPNDFRAGRYAVDLDINDLAQSVIDALGSQKEIYILHWLLLRLSGHQIELFKVLAQAFPELGKQIPRYFQKRTEDYRSALRMRKVFGFKSASAIEEEAVKRAWDDTRAMIREIYMMHDPSVKALVDDHREILKRLCAALIELVMENRDAYVDIDFNAFQKFLKS